MTGRELCKPAIFPRNKPTPGRLLPCVLGLVLIGACAQQAPRNSDSVVSLVVLPKSRDGFVISVAVRPASLI